MRTFVILLLLSSLPVLAQRRGRTTSRPRATGQPGSDLDILNTAVAAFDGTLRSLDQKHVLIEMGEEQTLSIEINKKTQFFRGAKAISASDFSAGAIVTVEAKKVANQLIAVSVRLKDPGDSKPPGR